MMPLESTKWISMLGELAISSRSKPGSGKPPSASSARPCSSSVRARSSAISKRGWAPKLEKQPWSSRVQQGHVHHRIFAAERGVLDQDAEARRAQGADAGRDARIAGDHFLRHVRQAQAFADDAELDVALENFRQRLGARLGRRVAGRHAVADVQVADDVDREPDAGAVALAHVGQGADAAFGVAGIEVDQRVGVDAAVRVVEAGAAPASAVPPAMRRLRPAGTSVPAGSGRSRAGRTVRRGSSASRNSCRTGVRRTRPARWPAPPAWMRPCRW